MYLIITIDTEADNQWSRSETVTLNNIAYIPRFQALCEQYHFKPTYLLTYEMATAPESIAQFGTYQQAQTAEIGAHLHPWHNPPHVPLTENDRRYHPFPCEYPPDVLRDKLQALTETIEQNFGRRPRSFRAGRYGCDDRVAMVLGNLGYVVDCSVTPLVSWKHRPGNPAGSGGPDFSGAPQQSYRWGKILEVPVSIFFLKARWLNWLLPRWKQSVRDPHNLLLRTLDHAGWRPMWFRPHPKSTIGEFRQLYDMAQALRVDYLEMMLHSSELMPGGSKNTPNAAAIETLYDYVHEVFGVLASQQVESVTLSEYAERR